MMFADKQRRGALIKKNIKFHNLFQKIVSEEEMTIIRYAIGYKDTARKIDVLTLINYLLYASMNELNSYRDCADVGDQYGLPKVNHSTLSKKDSHVDYNIMKKLFHLVVSKWNRIGFVPVTPRRILFHNRKN
ncbi:hypothetical protein BKP45_07760 [Anaerobacillus alkalidiazotrophicus]|uniref:Transposase n=1 Tax=Anaerobacillus alkalidiazotrophicus TaxID=472963 RepID=A0A1S2MB17_9BACI|nr:hypothetical protein BKP45_07760 [Anaerobacillus alkalidiazotrophicus]